MEIRLGSGFRFSKFPKYEAAKILTSDEPDPSKVMEAVEDK